MVHNFHRLHLVYVLNLRSSRRGRSSASVYILLQFRPAVPRQPVRGRSVWAWTLLLSELRSPSTLRKKGFDRPGGLSHLEGKLLILYCGTGVLAQCHLLYPKAPSNAVQNIFC